ncbi:MAG: ABC-F family ATP-binding cassette domain-containing protein, partial [Candidatus Izemoplasma sp.]
MNILSVSKLTKEFNGEALFSNVSFEINKGDKVAIIGRNGTGKSTILKMILGDIYIDSGEVYKNSKAQIGYLSQNVISSTEHTLLDEINEVFKDVLQLEQQIKEISLVMANDHSDKVLKRYERLEHEYSIKDGYNFHYRINLILSKFGFLKEHYSRKINTFSGGEKTRIAFAKLLLKNPDLLILDEPTNHLDIKIIEWLEDYLNKYNGAVLIVTHDKYFINRVCKKIIELDQGIAHIYHGTYEEYELEKVKRYTLLLKSYVKQQKEIAHLQSFVDRFRYQQTKAKQAQDRVKKINKIVRVERPTVNKSHVNMTFDKKRSTTEVILDAENLVIGYEKIIAKNITFSMRGFDKLAIIGPNGVGKTTLLKVIENKLPAISGKISFLRDFKIGYFDQNQDTLHINKTIFEEIHDYYPMFTNTQVRNKAAQFLFTNDDVHKSISILSGGEKVRLVLLLLMLEDPDLLILDEPTNHLDIETKSIIEDVFNEFSGPIIFVSHDRYFINKIGSKILYMEEEQSTVYEGTYDEYKVTIKN